MERRSFLKATAVATLATGVSAVAGSAKAQDKKFTIALIPGLTTDAFYITMRRVPKPLPRRWVQRSCSRAHRTSTRSRRCRFSMPSSPKKPDAILIAPTDKDQLIQPLKKAADAGIPVITVDTFIGSGVYQTGSGDADFRFPYIASGRPALEAQSLHAHLQKAVGEKGKSTFQTSSQHLDDRPA